MDFYTELKQSMVCLDANKFESLKMRLARKHKLEQSKQILNELIVDFPDFSPAYITMAYINYLQFDFQQGLNRAKTVIHQGKLKVDRNNYVRALVMAAGCKGMLAHYGSPFSKLAHGPAIMPLLKQAQILQPDNAAVSLGLGGFYLSKYSLAYIRINTFYLGITGSTIYDGYISLWYIVCVAFTNSVSVAKFLPVFKFRSNRGKLLDEISIRMLWPFLKTMLVAQRSILYS